MRTTGIFEEIQTLRSHCEWGVSARSNISCRTTGSVGGLSSAAHLWERVDARRVSPCCRRHAKALPAGGSAQNSSRPTVALGAAADSGLTLGGPTLYAPARAVLEEIAPSHDMLSGTHSVDGCRRDPWIRLPSKFGPHWRRRFSVFSCWREGV